MKEVTVKQVKQHINNGGEAKYCKLNIVGTRRGRIILEDGSSITPFIPAIKLINLN